MTWSDFIGYCSLYGVVCMALLYVALVITIRIRDRRKAALTPPPRLYRCSMCLECEAAEPNTLCPACATYWGCSRAAEKRMFERYEQQVRG